MQRRPRKFRHVNAHFEAYNLENLICLDFCGVHFETSTKPRLEVELSAFV